MQGDEATLPLKVAEKWGFGMAPPKEETERQRLSACEDLLRITASTILPEPTERNLEAISVVKGLFNRIVREDQWDWFTVSRQLGYPSRRMSRIVAKHLKSLRDAVKTQDAVAFDNARWTLCRLPMERCLSVFLGISKISDQPGAGWIYILSTRQFPKWLKIGMTTRTVEQRVRELNGATGVVVPFGAWRCWRVSDPTAAEELVHDALREYRVRVDREFFEIVIHRAVEIIDGVLRENCLEIRTLDVLESTVSPVTESFTSRRSEASGEEPR